MEGGSLGNQGKEVSVLFPADLGIPQACASPGGVFATAVEVSLAGEASPQPLPLLGGESHSSLPLPLLGGKVAISAVLLPLV